MLAIYWKSGDWKGHKDLLPLDWFWGESDESFLKHEVQNSKGKTAFVARCSLSVRGSIADIDYGGEHAAHNEGEGQFEAGTLRIIFADSSRSEVLSVQWRDSGPGEVFIDLDVEASAEARKSFDPTDIQDNRNKREQLVTLREGQAAFRSALMKAYDGRCAITGCSVREALEAAHIIRFLGADANHITNGLLLRADIHTLFDRGLLKIDRDYRVTASAEVSAAYDLPEKITLPLEPASYPSRKALEVKYTDPEMPEYAAI